MIIANMFQLWLMTALASCGARELKMDKKVAKKLKGGKAKKGETMPASKGPFELYLDMKEILKDRIADLGGDNYLEDPCGKTPCGSLCVKNDAFGVCNGAGDCRTGQQEWMDGNWVPCSSEDGGDVRKIMTAAVEATNGDDKNRLLTAEEYFEFCANWNNVLDNEFIGGASAKATVSCNIKYLLDPSDPQDQNNAASCYYNLMAVYRKFQDYADQICANDNLCPSNAVCGCESPNNPNNNAILCAYPYETVLNSQAVTLTLPCVPYYNGDIKVYCSAGVTCDSSNLYSLQDYNRLCDP